MAYADTDLLSVIRLYKSGRSVEAVIDASQMTPVKFPG